jgi:hypothetical protein
MMDYRKWALAGALVLLSGAALADDPMANTYANTVTTVDKSTGAEGTLLFNKDGTYGATATGKDGKVMSYTGKWTLKDGDKTICLTPNAPPDAKQAPQTSCSPLEKHNVGDSWTVTNDQNQTYDVSIKAGR